MTEADADRAKAAEVEHAWQLVAPGMDGFDRACLKPTYRQIAKRVAAALAAERAAAVADLRARVLALAEEWGDQSREWYYEHRFDAGGTTYACGFEDGWEHAAQLLRAAVTDTTGDPA